MAMLDYQLPESTVVYYGSENLMVVDFVRMFEAALMASQSFGILMVKSFDVQWS